MLIVLLEVVVVPGHTCTKTERKTDRHAAHQVKLYSGVLAGATLSLGSTFSDSTAFSLLLNFQSPCHYSSAMKENERKQLRMGYICIRVYSPPVRVPHSMLTSRISAYATLCVCPSAEGTVTVHNDVVESYRSP